MREILAVPFGWVLSAFYGLTDNYVLSIVLLTVLVKLLLLPASISQQKNSAKQTRLNTKVNKIRQKYAGNQQKIQEETQALYQREGFGMGNMGCTTMLIPLFVMIGLYGVIYTPITKVLNFSTATVEKIRDFMGIVVDSNKSGRAGLYYELNILNKFSEYKDSLGEILSEAEIADLAKLKDNFMFMGMDLTQTPNTKEVNILWLIPIFSCLTALASSLFMYMRQRKQNPEMAKNPSMGCMTFMSPAMSLWFTFIMPAGVGLYWIISNIISFIQQVVLTTLYSPKKVLAQQMVDETVARRSRENNVKRRVEMEKK